MLLTSDVDRRGGGYRVTTAHALAYERASRGRSGDSDGAEQLERARLQPRRVGVRVEGQVRASREELELGAGDRPRRELAVLGRHVGVGIALYEERRCRDRLQLERLDRLELREVGPRSPPRGRAGAR